MPTPFFPPAGARYASRTVIPFAAVLLLCQCRLDEPTGARPADPHATRPALAALAVVNRSDAGPGSLRQAILDAQSGDVIDLSGITGTITLSSGELAIGKDLTIVGPGADKLTVARDAGAAPFRIFNVTGGRLEISGLTITGGLADVGGGVRVENATVALSDCAIRGNAADTGRDPFPGSAIHSVRAVVSIDRCEISDNTGAATAGISAGRSVVSVVNSTISGNDGLTDGACVACVGGGIWLHAVSGATSTLELINSTVANNSGGQGHGVFLSGAGTTRVYLKNSIVADNVMDISSDDAGSAIVASVYSLVERTSMVANGDGNLVGVDPKLGALSQNGGPTRTHALGEGSPAIDAGSAITCAAAPVSDRDQRGYARLADAACDFGAYEADVPSPTPPPPPPPPPANVPPAANPGGPYFGMEGRPLSLALGGFDPDGDAVTYTWDLGDGTTGSGPKPPALHTYGDDGDYLITLTADDGRGGTATNRTTATVKNVAPIATFGYPDTVIVGTSFTLTMAGADDPSPADRQLGFAYEFDCGDGLGYRLVGPTSKTTCSGTRPGRRVVGARIRDKDAAFSVYEGVVQVVYVFTGFFSPVLNAGQGVNVAKAGSSIPVKFSLGGDYGLDVLAGGFPRSAAYACDAATVPNVIGEAANGALSYDVLTGAYTYTWKTEKRWAGTCRRLIVRLADGAEHLADFQFTR